VVHAAFIDGDASVMFLPTTTSNCSIVSRARLKSSFEVAATFVDLMFGFSARLNAFRLTQEETALFCALMLITPGITLHVSIVISNYNSEVGNNVLGLYACLQIALTP